MSFVLGDVQEEADAELDAGGDDFDPFGLAIYIEDQGVLICIAA